MKRIAIYPGTFDPITNGHIDVLERALELFDKVIISLAVNTSKTPLFSEKERLEMLKKVTEKYKRVEVDSFKCLLVDYAKKRNAIAIVKGLRAISDFEFEFQMALMNRKIYHEASTVFLMPNEKYTYISSTIIREMARLNGDIAHFVPPVVKKYLEEKFKNK
jgi:pantetheine-phosphate adenylyltransferase